MRSILAAGALAIMASACAPSKEDAAIERIKNRKRPGMVRLVNLTDQPLSLWVDAKSASDEMAAGKATEFLPEPAGTHQLAIKQGATTVASQPLEMGDLSENSALVYMEDGKPKLLVISGEPRRHQEGQVQLSVVVLGSGSAKVLANNHDVGPAVAAGKVAPVDALQAGKTGFDVSLDARKAHIDANLAAGEAYSLFATPDGSGLKLTLIKNSGDKPKAAGSANA